MKLPSYSSKLLSKIPSFVGALGAIRQKIGKAPHSTAVSCALFVVGVCLAITFVHIDYKAEAHVGPYSLHDNILRLPFSSDETLSHAHMKDMNNYVAGKTFRFSASTLPTEDLSPNAKKTHGNSSLCNLSLNAFLKTYGLPSHPPKTVAEITPKNTFLESLLNIEGQTSPYIQEANQCDPFDATPSLLVFSHKTPGKFTGFNKHGQSAHYRTLADRYADKYGLPANLVMAIIKTESNFNPHAVSSQQAIGLMQIVPSTAGEEVHAYLHGKSSAPGFDLLFQPDKNILYGTTYLHLLEKRYFQRIQDQTSRQLCIIAAYNGGPGAVLRVFDSNMSSALSIINAMSPDDVYSALSTGMPFAESRQYIDLVLANIRNF